MSWIKKNKLAFIIVVVLSFSGLLSIYYLIDNFHTQKLSSKMADWGSFGGYISGTVGVLLSFINVIILYRFSKVGERFNKESLNTQIKSTIFNSFIETLREQDQRLIKFLSEYNYTAADYTTKNINNYLTGFKREIETLLESAEKNYVYSLIEKIINDLNIISSYISTQNHPDLEKYYTSRGELVSCMLGLLVNK